MYVPLKKTYSSKWDDLGDFAILRMYVHVHVAALLQEAPHLTRHC